MSRIEELIEQFCPNGVEFKELGELGYLYGGLSGKSKNDFQDGNARFVTYKNVYSNIATKTDIDIFVKIAENEKQNKVEYGDVLFTGSSETPDECGMSSVLTEKINEPLYLNSFCFGFRLWNKDLFLPDFIKYLFRDTIIRKQIGQTASGVTRFNVSKKRFAKVVIPIPPIPLQQKIVTILDKYCQLEAKLEAELEAELERRKLQYDFYRNELFNFEGKEVEWKPLGEIGKFIRGKRFVKNDIVSEGVPCIHYGEMYTHYKIWAKESKSFLEPALAAKLRVANPGDVIIVAAGETVEDIGMGVAWLGESNVVIHDACFAFSHNQEPKYISHFLQTDLFHSQINRNISSAKISSINASGLSKAKIPIPPIKVQQEIVRVLDKFNTLVNKLSVGLPAEIKARRKQYEYYRGKLLSFKMISKANE
ncbi:MAG TPA: restriction endonuclease subunit S [Prolixibacteraceae bacterium]|nr:restriction endonuclease subunit S [Prolixibacteraceae bacterium]